MYNPRADSLCMLGRARDYTSALGGGSVVAEAVLRGSWREGMRLKCEKVANVTGRREER